MRARKLIEFTIDNFGMLFFRKRLGPSITYDFLIILYSNDNIHTYS